jgi:hypothetical protein
MRHSPSILQPVEEDIDRLDRVLTLLETEHDPTSRADLAEELVHEAALLEDANDRAVYPSLVEAGFEAIADELRRSGESLRGAMDPVFLALHHSVPMDAHFNDDNLDQEIERLREATRSHLVREIDDLSLVQAEVGRDAADRLRRRLGAARRHAVDRPRPSQNPLRRAMTRLSSRIERRFPDTASQYRPGREKLES